MRFDRAITLGLGGLFSKLSRPKHRPVAILMYHAVSGEREHNGNAYFNTAVSPQRFEEHLRILSGPLFRVAPLGSIRNADPAHDDGRLNVIITFDDAFLSVATEAFPLLQRYGFPATVYYPTAFIGTGKLLLPNRPHMSWNDAKHLAENGIAPGTHTVTHQNLRALTFAQIDEELGMSKKTIEQNTGIEVLDFSCPFSFPEEDAPRVLELRASLVRHGYRTGVTTRIGRADAGDDPFILRRLPVNNDDDEALFRAKLEGAYDWLAALQLAKKKLFPIAVKRRS